MVLGIPTVKREVQSYLLATLQNILDSMTPEEEDDVLIVVFIAEVSCFHSVLAPARLYEYSRTLFIGTLFL